MSTTTYSVSLHADQANTLVALAQSHPALRPHAVHLAAIPGASDSKWTEWTKYVDVVGGFQSLNYKPDPADPAASPRSQSLFFGVALNMQHVLDRVFGTDPDQSGAAKWTHEIGHHVFEYMSVPFTTLRIGDAERSPD